MDEHAFEPLLPSDEYPSWVADGNDDEYKSQREADYRDFHDVVGREEGTQGGRSVHFEDEDALNGVTYDHDGNVKNRMDWNAEESPAGNNGGATGGPQEGSGEGGKECCGGGSDEVPPKHTVVILRLANLAASGLLLFCSGNVLFSLGMLSLSHFVLAAYGIVFGTLACCNEIDLPFLRTPIASNFGFLYSPIFKFLFYVLMGTVSWSFGTLLGMIASAALGVLAVGNACVLCRYPGYRRALRELSDGESREVEQRARREAKKQAWKSAMSGSWWKGGGD